MKGRQLLTKLCVKNAIDIREFTIQMPEDSDFIANVIAAARNYNDEQLEVKSSTRASSVREATLPCMDCDAKRHCCSKLPLHPRRGKQHKSMYQTIVEVQQWWPQLFMFAPSRKASICPR